MWGGIALLALYTGGNVYLFVRLWQSIAPLPVWLRVVIALLFWFAAAAMFLSFEIRNSGLPESIIRSIFWVGTTWLAFMLYMVLATATMDLVRLFIPTLHNGFWYALLATTIVLIYGNINYRHPRVEHVTIDSEKLPAGDSYRIVLASDIHLGYGTTRSDLSRYVDMINREQGDVVLIAGDLIDNSIRPVATEDMCREFERIKAPDGIYLAPGNHEYISNIDSVAQYLRTTPVRLVRDSVVRLGNNITLIARDDRSNRHRRSLKELSSEAGEQPLIVVLDHQPYDIAASDSLGLDLHLSGHTHRGQVWPLSWLTDALYDQSHGYRQWSHTHAVVSSGLSLWGPPFRIGTRSDIYVIDIRGNSAE